jgi:uncharacterized protein (TIGR02271 family)
VPVPSDRAPEPGPELVRSEEELRVGTRTREVGRAGIRKHVEHEHVSQVVGREVEHADTERHPAEPEDSGEVLTLEDGSISIPVFEERLVVEKRRVVTERIIVRKRTVIEEEVVEADLAKERVEIVADPEVAGRVHVHDSGSGEQGR